MALAYASPQELNSEKIIRFSIKGQGSVEITTNLGVIQNNNFVHKEGQKSYSIQDDGSPILMQEAFTADGVTNLFTLLNPVDSASPVTVSVAGVPLGETDFSIYYGTGNGLFATPGTISLTTTPLSGASVIVAYSRVQTAWFSQEMNRSMNSLVAVFGGTATMRQVLGTTLYKILIQMGQMKGEVRVGV